MNVNDKITEELTPSTPNINNNISGPPSPAKYPINNSANGGSIWNRYIPIKTTKIIVAMAPVIIPVAKPEKYSKSSFSILFFFLIIA